MKYDDIFEGQEVQLTTKGRRPTLNKGIVRAKAIETIAGREKEVVYVDIPYAGRRRCAPSVLEAV